MIKKTVLTTAAACMMSVAVQAGEVPFITLNNGTKIPQFGLGTFGRR